MFTPRQSASKEEPIVVKMTVEEQAKGATLLMKDDPALTAPVKATPTRESAEERTHWGKVTVKLYGEEMADDSKTALSMARHLIRNAKFTELRERPIESRYCRWWLLYLWHLTRTPHIEVYSPSGEALTPEGVDWDGHLYALLGLITGEMLDIPALPVPPASSSTK